MELSVSSDDRGQMILIAAIGLAILLTLLALTLNTAVFGEIHAAESGESLQAERGAVQYQYSVDRGVSGLLVELNRDHDEYEALERELDDAITAWSDLSGAEQIRDGERTNASLERVTFETHMVQDEPRAFTDRAENTEWVIAEDVSEVREFEMDVHEEELVETSDCSGVGGCFSLRVEGSDGASWELFVYDNGGVTVTIELASGDNETYGPAGTSAQIDVTEGIFDVDGAEEAFTTFLDDDLEAPYTLTYTNADNAEGTYGLTVDGKIVEETIADDERYDVDESPKISARIVAADVRVRYASADLTYETEMEVVPGETDD